MKTFTPGAYYSHARWNTIPLEATSLTDGFWSGWQELNRTKSLQHGYKMLEEAGNFDNLRLAAGLIKDKKFRGFVFQDSDIYKWLEAVGYELHTHPNAALRKQADEVIDLIAAAQADDGYINSYIQVVNPQGRWSDMDFGHELYCAGHLFQGAVAYYRGTQSTRLLEISTRFADLLVNTFGINKKEATCGHPEIEMALVELYRVTGKESYLVLAQFLVDQRGKGVMRGLGWMKSEYHQDRVPVRQAHTIEGHAVRAMYLNAGVTDIYLETGEQTLLDVMNDQWQDMVTTKIFVTGGLGARYEGEAFGDSYELPSDRCYCETCAAIGSFMWNWRMLLATGEGRFASLMEHTLYNSILSGMGNDGEHFYYMNPLLSRGGYERKRWLDCACCPPNLMRLLASLGQYFATHSNAGVQVHQYDNAVIHAPLPSGNPVKLTMQSHYPWHGNVKLRIEDTDGSDWQLLLRVPEWTIDLDVSINGKRVDNPVISSGYLALERAWQAGDGIELTLQMTPELIEANPRVDAVRNSVAIQYGPLIYCVEAHDHPHVNLMDVQIDPASALQTFETDSGTVGIKASGSVLNAKNWQSHLYRRLRERDQSSSDPITLTAVPYYTWSNRGENAMRIWIPIQT